MKEKNKTSQNKNKKEIKLTQEFIGFFPKFRSGQGNLASLAKQDVFPFT